MQNATHTSQSIFQKKPVTIFKYNIENVFTPVATPSLPRRYSYPVATPSLPRILAVEDQPMCAHTLVVCK